MWCLWCFATFLFAINQLTVSLSLFQQRLLSDYYLWGFTIDESDLHNSLGYSMVVVLVCYGLGCETTMTLFQQSSRTFNEIAGRIRTFLLALGTVNFWRIVWYVWDDFILGPTTTSSVLSHAVGVIALLAMGCMASILAPASTLGVDAIPHPDCAEEPLFAMIPITTPTLCFFGIGRMPLKTLQDQDIYEEDVQPQSFRETTFLEMQRPNLVRRQSRKTRQSILDMPTTRRPSLVRQQEMHDLGRPVLKRHESTFFRNR